MSSKRVGVSGKLEIGPDFFSKSARAFLNGVGVRGVSPEVKNIRLLGVTTPSDVDGCASILDIPCGVFNGL